MIMHWGVLFQKPSHSTFLPYATGSLDEVAHACIELVIRLW